MPKQDKQRDYNEIAKFSENYKGKSAIECITAYANKRRMVSHRAGAAFWDNVSEGNIKVVDVDGISYIE